MNTHAARTIAAEPAELPINAMIELAEQACRQVIDFGGAEALRVRLDRLLPNEDLKTVRGRDAERELSLAAGITLCKRIGRFKLSADEHKAIGVLRQMFETELDVARGTK